jgi:hypothetical protein
MYGAGIPDSLRGEIALSVWNALERYVNYVQRTPELSNPCTSSAEMSLVRITLYAIGYFVCNK